MGTIEWGQIYKSVPVKQRMASGPHCRWLDDREVPRAELAAPSHPGITEKVYLTFYEVRRP